MRMRPVSTVCRAAQTRSRHQPSTPRRRGPGAEAAGRLLGSDEFRREAESLRQGDLIDYEAVAYLKKKALRAAFEAFQAFDPKGREAAAFKFCVDGVIDHVIKVGIRAADVADASR